MDFFGKGINALKEQHFEEAIQYFTQTLEADPQKMRAYYHRGEAYYFLEKYQEAEQDFTKVLNIYFEDYQNCNNAYFYCGHIYYLWGDYQKIIDHYLADSPDYNSSSWKNEKDAFQNMINKFGSGLYAVVSDSYDIYNACENIWPSLKEDIIREGGTLVVRPDSGNPVPDCAAPQEAGSRWLVKPAAPA